MSIDYDDISLADSPILALSQCFAECHLPHTLLSDHCVTLDVTGAWQKYEIAFAHQDQSFVIAAPLPLAIADTQHDHIYSLIGRMNADVPLGHFQLDTEQNSIEYRYTLPASVLAALDMDAVEDLIEVAVMALETLYPAAETLLSGASDVQTALGKYLYPAQGNA